ncbi:hypothetical protein [Granulicella sp. dw_53]|uniref:hypothetical protein n=1 Tax=Granulicella sp. dw_53 TaxID=2719792 RepID=UPI001BD6B382|nr:hypothetical protein [Granulicella sp. dw_53]
MPNDWVVRKLQFRVLYRVFFMRVIDLELLSMDADPTKLIGQFATIFASISFFLTLPALLTGFRRLSIPGSWMFEHFLIETTMTIAGLIAVLSWDSAFPDQRDVLVLAPLPVRTSTLFVSKISALFAAPALGTIAFNFFSGVAWPLSFISSSYGFLGALRSWPTYWMTIFLGGAFFVFTVLAIQGLAANLLPRQIFLRLSAFLQAGAMCLLLSVYFLEPSLRSPADFTALENQRMLAWLPSYWFLGLFQQLNGSMHPALAPLARRAWIGLAISFLGTVAALLLSYFRMMPKVVEQPDILPRARTVLWSPRFGSSLKSAVTLFSLRTLLRSRQHRMIVSFYLGIGLAIVVGYIKGPFGGLASTAAGISLPFLLVSILMMILILMSIRVVASIPISLRANWIIRVTQVRPAHQYQRAVRFSWMVLGVAPVLLVLAGSFAGSYPWQQVLGHLVTMLFLGIVLVELCLYTFQKIPFTCSYLPGKANIHFVFWACLMLFLRLLKEGAIFEGRMLHSFLGWILMVVLLAAAALAARWLTEARAGPVDEVLFEEEYPVEIISLKLN